MKKAPQTDQFFSISENLKFWHFCGSFSALKIYRHMETDKFPGIMLLDFSGTYFVFINYSIFFLYWPLLKKLFYALKPQNIA